MAVTIKPITLWQSEIQDRPGALAAVLSTLKATKADLKIVMGYKVPGDRTRAVLELWPVAGRRREVAAERAGFSPSATPTLLVTGDDRAGLGHALTQALADAGINLSFMVALVAGRKHSTVFGFETEEDAKKGAALIRKASSRRR
jgi:hypothetical protein